METKVVNDSMVERAEVPFRGKILVVGDGAKDLEAYSSCFRQAGFDVRVFAPYPEGLSCLESEHFDLIMLKLREVPDLQDEKCWSVKSRFPAAGLSCLWQAVSIGMVTWIWRTWELWTN
jgi:response regulator RpfG family c-di-GMP phosphodiesterase